MKNKKAFLACISLLSLLLILSCSSNNDLRVLDYKIINKDVSESQSETFVELNVLITSKDNITTESVNNLLVHLYDSLMSTDGYKYHNSPTSCNIFLFLSHEHYESGMAQWVGNISKAKTNTEPSIRLGKEQFNLITQKEEIINGLTLDKRKEIWNKLIEAEDKSNTLAEEKFPIKITDKQLENIDDIEKHRERAQSNSSRHYEYAEELLNKYKMDIVAEYQISEEILNSISGEGLANGWPFPKRKNGI